MCHCTSPKDNKSKKICKNVLKTTLASACCPLYITYQFLHSRYDYESNLPVTLALLPRKQNGPHEKLLGSLPFQIQCTQWWTPGLGYSAVWLQGLEEQCWCRLEKRGAKSVDAPWAVSGKSRLEIEISLQWVRGKRHFHLSSHHESQVTDWRDGVVEVVVGNVACCWLVGLKRWDFRRKLKICDGKDSTKRRDNNLSCSSGTLWQVKGHNAKGMEQCKGELNLKISYWRNDRHQTPSWIWA